MNVLQIVENEQNSEFYPTPQSLVEKMIEGIDWRMIGTVLEPSAGKGDILRNVAKETTERFYKSHLDVDCIEIDPNLRAVLKYNFSDDREKAVLRRKREIEDSREYDREKGRYKDLPPSTQTEWDTLNKEEKTFFQNGIHIVHDDFLTYSPFKQYDLIIMNPPFSNGDKHLLKALDIQKRGGNIVCLLNAETIRNPYTETRRELVRLLDKYNAQIEYIENAFTTAERKTGVEVALIKVSIEKAQDESDIYNRMREAEEMEDIDVTCTDLEVSDYIKAIISRFNVEVKSGIELIKQYRAMIPYMLWSFDSDEKSPILRLTDSTDRGYDSVSINSFLKAVRLKYWRALLSNPKFIGKLTSKLQEQYSERVDKLANYDFTEYNIRTLSAEMNAQIKQGVEDEIIAMFDRLTEEHSWYPETQKNRHYFDGWATNKAHKIGNKVIIPCYGVYDSWSGKPRTYTARGVLEDIERILNFFDSGMAKNIDLWHNLDFYFKQGITKKVPLKFFEATFYKKGTIHLTFTCPELIERFNINAGQQKAWLPPSYGKKVYKDMSEQEKAVIDSFQGEQAYNEIMAKANYYLAPVTNNQMLLIE